MDEAASKLEPRSSTKGHKCVKSSGIQHKQLIIILLILVLILMVSNCIAYKLISDMRCKFNTAYKIFNTDGKDSLLLNKSLEKMLKDNNKLKKDDTSSGITDNKDISEAIDNILKQSSALEQTNKELEEKILSLQEDNYELQNSLKMAASAGVKPQNYRRFGGFTSRGDLNRGEYIGKFLGTAYTPSKEECGNDRGMTNSGKPIIPGISIAIDNKYWPFGTVFYIKGLGYAVAMDTGGSIKGKYRFDFAVFDKQFAKILGERKWDVYLVKLGNGKIEDVKF